MEPGGETLTHTATGESTGAWAGWRGLPRPERLRIGGLAGWVALATLAFLLPLTRLALHAVGSELHSYIPLVPFIAAYLLYVKRASYAAAASRTSVGGAVLLGAVAAGALAAAINWQGSLSVNDGLGLLALAYVCVLAAGGFLFVGATWMRAAAFPVAFLLFLIPLPDVAVTWLETGSVLASADVAAWFFNITGTPLLRDGEVFALPGIVLRIAEECSGIRSSWVLFITSLLASQLFLTSRWRRLVLVAFVIPLGIVRNGFRVLVIGLLCVHIGPHMIDSVIHHRGGPLFFALSLVPLGLLVLWLRRQDR